MFQKNQKSKSQQLYYVFPIKFFHSLIFTVFIFLISHSAYAKEYSYKSVNDLFKLKTTIKDVRTSSGIEKLVLYSVFKNGKFIRSWMRDGGRFFSCRIEPKVIPISSNQSQIGWLILGGGICGNTFSYNVELILPSSNYLSKTFISKEIPHIKQNQNNVELLYYKQYWGKGGTASSYFIPKKITIDLKKSSLKKISKGVLFSDIDDFKNLDFGTSFIGLFLCGVENLNPEIMQYALNHLYSEEDIDWYKVHFPRTDRGYFKSLIQKVKVTMKLFQDMDNLTSLDKNQ